MADSNHLLAPLSALYGAATRARLALYRKGLLTTRKVAAPVISVGNITTGGTGKTPLVAWLAHRLAAKEQRVCILTRGYGRANPSDQVLVSDGQHVLAGTRDAGDEPRLLAESLVGIAAVVCNADRVSAAEWAIENLRSTVFILDDGFQHLNIARDLNLVTIDSTNPWGNHRLLPRGHMREPRKGLERADAVILSRSNLVNEIAPLRAEVESLVPGRPVILSQMRTAYIRRLFGNSNTDEAVQVKGLPPQPIAAFCALGNSQAFFAHLRKDRHEIVYEKSFRDHHVYTQVELNELVKTARDRGANSMVTTAKDAVKLGEFRFEIPCYVIDIDLTFDDERTLLALVEHAISTASSA